MRVYGIIFMLCMCLPFSTQAQQFSLELTSDSILAGNILNITFKAENLKGQFEGPDLKSMQVVSGPNTSTSMQMINGDVTQSATYSYGVLLEDVGEVVILPAYYTTEEGVLETEPTTVVVLPNPEGIIEQPPSRSGFFEFGFPQSPNKLKKPSKTQKKKRKKRKLKKL